MSMKFVKVYYDWLDMMEPLSDEEKGRLITAVLQYASGQQVPDFVGAEKYTFYAMKSQIDRDQETYAAICAKRKEIGALGGLAKASKRCQTPAKASKCYQALPNDTKTCQDKDKEKDKTPSESKRKPFCVPSLEEVRAYCRSRNSPVNPEAFHDYYTAKGWVVGRAPMKDWRAAVRNWERNEKPTASAEKEDPYADVIV